MPTINYNLDDIASIQKLNEDINNIITQAEQKIIKILKDSDRVDEDIDLSERSIYVHTQNFEGEYEVQSIRLDSEIDKDIIVSIQDMDNGDEVEETFGIFELDNCLEILTTILLLKNEGDL